MAEKSLSDPVHFIGMGGAGMSGLAELAVRRGLAVQGSDAKPSPMLQRLTELGAKVTQGHDAASLGEARTVVYSSAIQADNAELSAAKQRGLTTMHRSEFLAYLMQQSKPITVAGTHGKSTTSAMITHILDALGLDPTAAVGGVLRAYGSTARFGQGELFVAEADESDGSFLKYKPYVGVLTNIALDHLEFYKDAAHLEDAFAAYLQRIDPDGCAVIGWDNALARQVGAAYAGNRLTYGFTLGSEVRAFDYRVAAGETTFTAIVEHDRFPCRLTAMGRHNVQNALCALAVTRALALDVKLAAESLASFQGVDRRMTLVYEVGGVRIYDDYAHNPGKIAACVGTLKEAFPDAPLHVVYQPHRYTRLETMYDDMLGAIDGADFVYVVPVYSAGETTQGDYSPKRLADDLNSDFRVKAVPCASLESAADAVSKALAGIGDGRAVVLTVGAGDVWQVAELLKRRWAAASLAT